MRLGYQYSLWGAPAIVALELNLFKTHGIEVEAKRMSKVYTAAGYSMDSNQLFVPLVAMQWRPD